MFFFLLWAAVAASTTNIWRQVASCPRVYWSFGFTYTTTESTHTEAQCQSLCAADESCDVYLTCSDSTPCHRYQITLGGTASYACTPGGARACYGEFKDASIVRTSMQVVALSEVPPSPPPHSPPPPPPTTFYIRGSRSQIVFGTNDECTLELASGATSLTSSCPINTPSSRRLEDASKDSDRIAQLETRIAQLEMDKAIMNEQLQFLTAEVKMLKEQRKAP